MRCVNNCIDVNDATHRVRIVTMKITSKNYSKRCLGDHWCSTMDNMLEGLTWYVSIMSVHWNLPLKNFLSVGIIHIDAIHWLCINSLEIVPKKTSKAKFSTFWGIFYSPLPLSPLSLYLTYSKITVHLLLIFSISTKFLNQISHSRTSTKNKKIM